jgi:formyltetrahydrofolate synthetase
VRQVAKASGALDAVVSDVWAKGGAGGAELAQAVVEACEQPSEFKYLYPDDMPIEEKIETIARKIYGAGSVEYAPEAKKKLEVYARHGYDKFPICMAKTHLSLSHDKKFLGRPQGFLLPIRDVRASAGAGFLYPLCGAMRTMPGLPTSPAGNNIDIDENGNVVGLF